MFRNSICAALVVASASFAQDGSDPDNLWTQATLYRDEWGSPHIFADNYRSMAFAFGYAQAEDHLETMLMAYRVANGRAAEVWGQRAAASDEFAIRMNHAGLARRAYRAADAVTRDLCEGFALGVNTWLLENLDRAPSWAEGVGPSDILAFLHYYLMSMAPLDIPAGRRDSPRARGLAWDSPRATANAWAIGPEKSQSGDAMLVINPHTDYAGVFQWTEVHLVAEDYEVAGATLYGLPIVLQGHNRTLGWALSPNAVDFADVYVEPSVRFGKRNPKSVMPARGVNDETLYRLLVATDAKPLYVRTDSGFEERYVSRLQSPRGPVVDLRDGRALSYRVGGYGEFGAIRQLLEMGRATSLESFRAALNRRQIPSFHIVYADRAGNIFYLYNATVGQKQDVDARQNAPGTWLERSAWDTPLASWDPTYEWGPVIPIESLPSLLNPSSGYVQACTTPPWLATSGSGSGPGDWPRWFARDRDSYRAKRVRQLLEQGPRSLQDNQAMLYDLVAPFAVDAVPYLLGLAENRPEFVAAAHPDLAGALDMLREWNFSADTDSMAMTFFHVWWSTFQSSYSPETTRSPEFYYELLRENTPFTQEHALQSASEAAKLMRNQYQSISVPWGDVHRLRRGDREVALGGAVSGEPLFMASDDRYVNGVWPVDRGTAFAMVVRFGEEPEAVSLLPFGASDNPESPHYDDQLDLMLDRRFKVVRFNPRDVQRYAESARGRVIRLREETGLGTFTIRTAVPVEARLVSVADPPEALPAGLAPFSLVTEAQISPENVPAEILVQFTVPESICGDQALSRLAVYAYDPQGLWRPVPRQKRDASGRNFTALGYRGQLFAVAGPVEYLRGNPAELGDLDGAPAQVTRRTTILAKRPIADIEILQPQHGDRAKMGTVPSEARAPWTVPTFANPEAIKPRTLVPGSKRLARPPDTSDETPMTDARPDPVPAEVGDPRVLGPTTGAETRQSTESSAGVPPANPSGVHETRAGLTPKESTPSESAPKKRGRVTMTMKSLAELRGIPRSKSNPLPVLVSDRVKASQMVVGSKLRLRAPDTRALFHLTMEKTIRARVALETAPTPFPEGLAAFTPVYAIVYEPRNVAGSAAISIQLERGVCARDRFEDLQLYVHDDMDGWQILAGHKKNPAAQSVTAFDFTPRTYVVLGPQELLLKAPSIP